MPVFENKLLDLAGDKQSLINRFFWAKTKEQRRFSRNILRAEIFSVANVMGRGQPGCQEEWKMCRKEKKSSNADVMYIHVCTYVV